MQPDWPCWPTLLDIPEIIVITGMSRGEAAMTCSPPSLLSFVSIRTIYRGTQKYDIEPFKGCMTDVPNVLWQGPIYIVVDNLDECPYFPRRPSAREEMLEFVEEIVTVFCKSQMSINVWLATMRWISERCSSRRLLSTFLLMTRLEKRRI